MKRRKFLQWIGVGGAAMVVTPKVLLPKPEDITTVPGVKEVVPVSSIDKRYIREIIIEGNYREGEPGKDVKFLLATSNYDRAGNSFTRKGDLIITPYSGIILMVVDKLSGHPYQELIVNKFKVKGLGKSKITHPFQEIIVVRPVKRHQRVPAIKDKEVLVIVGNTFMVEGTGMPI